MWYNTRTSSLKVWVSFTHELSKVIVNFASRIKGLENPHIRNSNIVDDFLENTYCSLKNYFKIVSKLFIDTKGRQEVVCTYTHKTHTHSFTGAVALSGPKMRMVLSE